MSGFLNWLQSFILNDLRSFVLANLPSFILNVMIATIITIYFQKRLEAYKSELVKEVEKHKSSLEPKVHVSKVRFDTEFQILREFSLLLNELVGHVDSFYLIGNDKIGNKS